MKFIHRKKKPKKIPGYKFIKRVNPDAPPLESFIQPGRPKKAKYMDPKMDFKKAKLPYSEKELNALTFVLGMSEGELREELQCGRIPRYPTGGFSHPLYTRWRYLKKVEKSQPQSVCLRWLISFRHFCLDVGRPDISGKKLTKVKDSRPWEPNNVRWV